MLRFKKADWLYRQPSIVIIAAIVQLTIFSYLYAVCFDFCFCFFLFFFFLSFYVASLNFHYKNSNNNSKQKLDWRGSSNKASSVTVLHINKLIFE